MGKKLKHYLKVNYIMYIKTIIIRVSKKVGGWKGASYNIFYMFTSAFKSKYTLVTPSFRKVWSQAVNTTIKEL